jgi:hypothetical protein
MSSFSSDEILGVEEREQLNQFIEVVDEPDQDDEYVPPVVSDESEEDQSWESDKEFCNT